MMVGHFGQAQSSGYLCKGLVKFDLEGTIPYGAKIEAAQLWMFEKESKSGVNSNNWTAVYDTTEVWAHRINKNIQYGDVNLTWDKCRYGITWEYTVATGVRDINHEP